MAITFDTLAYAKKLKEVGVPEQQAEVQAEALAEIIDARLATKEDIKDVRRDMKEMREYFDNRFNELNYKLTIKLGSLIIAAVTALAIVIKL